MLNLSHMALVMLDLGAITHIRVLTHRGNDMRGIKLLRGACIGVLFGAGHLLLPTAMASDISPQRSHPTFHVYLATGLGFSHLNPDTSEVTTDVIDRVNAAGQITLGLDINKWFSAEAHSADLGSAGLNNNARINYHVHGASGLVYFGGNRGRHARQGLVGFGRIGLGHLKNSPVGEVRFERDNPVHLLFGAGIEYTSSYGLGGRLELLSFDNDAFYTQLALLYRFGGRHQSAPRLIAAVETPPVVAPAPVAPPVPAVAVVNPDRDGDGILNEIDDCPNTGHNISVNAKGCALFNGVADGVGFVSNSAELTPVAKAKLNSIVALLLEHTSVNATIAAHTDSRGSTNYNSELSRLRAIEVVSYLGSKGVNVSRLSAKSFGESIPIASNDTADGRAKNRRVEIVVQKESR